MSVHPKLQRFQAVVWERQQYKWGENGFWAGSRTEADGCDSQVDDTFHSRHRYTDDIVTPEDQAEVVTTLLQLHGLPTKPPVDFQATSVLGLKLSEVNGRL